MIISRLRSVLVLGLVLWCAGTGCMLVSYAHGAVMSDSAQPKTASGESWSGVSASAGNHNCCKARHSSKHDVASSATSRDALATLGQEVQPEPSNPSEAMSCCPLTSGTFVVTPRQSVTDDRASESISEAAVLVLTNVAAAPRTLPLRLSDQEQTYLRCCAFLI